jgi:hypothetical protein
MQTPNALTPVAPNAGRTPLYVQGALPADFSPVAQVKPVIPSLTAGASLGRDAFLPNAEPERVWLAGPFAEVAARWLAAIEAEQLVDLEISTYRTPTTTAPRGMYLRPTDGGWCRKGDDSAIAITPNAASQIVGLMLTGHADRPNNATRNLAWYSPKTRAVMFAELRDRSPRKEGQDHAILVRTFIDPASGVRAARAFLTGRHSGQHFDDRNVAAILGEFVFPTARAYVRRNIDETRGYASIDGEQNGVEASVHFRNSETGGAQLSFAGGVRITALDAQVRQSYTGQVETVEKTIEIANTHGGSRRNHTLPRKNRTEAERAEIARSRISQSITAATQSARHMVARWGEALAEFPAHLTAIPEGLDRKMAAQIFLDAVEELTAITAADRLALAEVIENSDRLAALPFLSAAHVTGAFAVLASKQTDADEAGRLQVTASEWVLQGWKR